MDKNSLNAEPPVVDAWRHDARTWKMWCEYDQAFHVHGAQPGHRVAHCWTPSSPYLATGYTLRFAGEVPADMVKKRRRGYVRASKGD